MKREEFLVYAVGELLARKQPGKPLKVAIDGRSAAGKTTLCGELAEELRRRGVTTLLASADDFHHSREHRYRQGELSAIGYYQDAVDIQAIIDSLLAPLSGHCFPVDCQISSRDFRRDIPSNRHSVGVAPDTVLLFDGLFLFRPELNIYWDYRILVHIPPETSLERGLARDVTLFGSPEAVERRYNHRYEPAWQIYESRDAPWERADLIIGNASPQSPRMLKS